MPRNTMVVPPRPGHIDMEDDLVMCHAGVSVDYATDPDTNEVVAVLHIDVARGDEIDTPFSVGLPLALFDVERLITSLSGTSVGQMSRVPRGERLN